MFSISPPGMFLCFALWFWTNMIKIASCLLCLLVILMAAFYRQWHYGHPITVIMSVYVFPTPESSTLASSSGIYFVFKDVGFTANYPCEYGLFQHIKDQNNIFSPSWSQVSVNLQDTGRILSSDLSLKWHLCMQRWLGGVPQREMTLEQVKWREAPRSGM